jgi:transcription elongation factor GreA
VSQIAHTGTVIFGTTVSIINLDTDEEKVYCIVGEDEADIKAGKISIGSPIARALIGKSEGDEVRVTTPGGMVEYEIAEVQHLV